MLRMVDARVDMLRMRSRLIALLQGVLSGSVWLTRDWIHSVVVWRRRQRSGIQVGLHGHDRHACLEMIRLIGGRVRDPR